MLFRGDDLIYGTVAEHGLPLGSEVRKKFQYQHANHCAKGMCLTVQLR